MGKLKNWLVNRFGESMTLKVLALTGALIISLLSPLPVSEFLLLIPFLRENSIFYQYFIIAWAAFMLYIEGMVILFFGKESVAPIESVVENVKTEEEPTESTEPETVSNDEVKAVLSELSAKTTSLEDTENPPS